MEKWLQFAVLGAGVAQLVLVVASVFIPHCLNWSDSTKGMSRLVLQLFWTYAGYILMCHLFFGLVSVLAASELIAGGTLALFLSGLMCVWWTVRIFLQFFCFDRSCIPNTPFNTIAEMLLVMMFIYLATVYGIVFWRNLLC